MPITDSSARRSASSVPALTVKTTSFSVWFSAVRIWQSSSMTPTVGWAMRLRVSRRAATSWSSHSRANSALRRRSACIDVIVTYRSHAGEAEALAAEIAALGRTAVALPLDVGDVGSLDAFAAAVRDALRTTIVNLSSGLARFTSPQRAVYGSVKGAVEVLTRYMAAELGPRGITVNVIAPGAVATDFSGGLLRDNPDVREHIAGMTALGRSAVADDIGGAIAALLRPGNRWVTGQRIEVSGGLHL